MICFSLMRQYKPVSLIQLQRLIDLGRLDPNEPIDLTSICNSKFLILDPSKREFGMQLTDEVTFFFLIYKLFTFLFN